MKKQMNNRILIISEDYSCSYNQERMANMIIAIWYHDIKTRDGEYVKDRDIIPINPYFVIKKNRWGFADENVRIPLELLPQVLVNHLD